MEGIENWELIVRLILSAVLGGLIGMEREANNRPAGLRTHVLVALGSCLIMLISVYGFSEDGDGDPARLAAQVVSGIGFLGAGTILRNGNNIKGLTTAASLWVSGGIGLAIGNGYYVGGLSTAIIVLFTLITLGLLEKRIFKNKHKILVLNVKERPGLIADITKVLGEYSITIKDIKISHREDDHGDEREIAEIHFTLKTPRVINARELFDSLSKIRCVEGISWTGDDYQIHASQSYRY